MELSEYGGSGRRSFVIIPEGDEGMGWKECRMQLFWLKQRHEKQHAEGTHADKALVETQMGNAVKESQRVHGKVSYAEAVTGKGKEAEQSGAQLAGDHGAATVKEKHIMESAEDKLTANHAGLNEKIFSQITTVKEKLIKESDKDKLTMNHAGFNEKRFLQLITEGNIMAIQKMLIAFKEEINSCMEKIEVGVESYWAELGPKIKHQQAEPWAQVEQPKYVKKPKQIVKKTYFRRKTFKSKPLWRLKNTAALSSEKLLPTSEQLLESRRKISPELNLGSTGTDQAA